MEDLIKALQIFLKYGNPIRPTICEHDVLYILYSPNDISTEDKKELEELGFDASEDNENFYSIRYGSA